MKHYCLKIATLALSLLFLIGCAFPISAATIDVTDFTIETVSDTELKVTWADSADAVLKSTAEQGRTTEMTIACSFTEAYVWYETGSQVVSSSLSSGKITFSIPGAGVYHIVSGQSPYRTVTFSSGGGSKVSAQTVKVGSTVTQPTTPTREGYTFEGWCQDEGLSKLWNFQTDTVTGDLTLYAKWREDPKEEPTKPTETTPEETTKPTETTPEETTKPTETVPEETTKPTETVPEETTKPTETVPEETTKPTETVPEETTKPTETVPEETTKPTETTPEETTKPTEIPSTISKVEISPKKVTLKAGESQQFTAKVSGTGEFDGDVIWSVSGNQDSTTTISAAGKLTLGKNESAKKMTVTATSRQDTGKSASATVKLQSAVISNLKDWNPTTGDYIFIAVATAMVSGSALGILLILSRRKKH